jgi:hypothetical protein
MLVLLLASILTSAFNIERATSPSANLDVRMYVTDATAKPKVLWGFNTDGSVFGVASGNLTRDGSAVVAGVIWGSNNTHAIFKNGTEFWKLTVDGEAYSVATGDLNDDGFDDAAIGTSNGTVYAIDHDGKVLWTYHNPETSDVFGVCIGDVGGDSQLDVVSGCDSVHPNDGAIIAIRANGTVLWKYQRTGLSMVMYTPLQITDIDGDGKADVVSGAADGVYAIKSDGSLLFHYPASEVRSIAIADFYGNGSKTIVAGSYGKYVYAVRTDGTLLWSHYTGGTYGAVEIAVGDIDGIPGDEVLRIFLGDPDDNGVYGIKGDGSFLRAFHAGSAPRSLAIGDIDGDSKNEVIAGVDVGHVCAFRVDQENPIWNFSTSHPRLGNVFDLELVDLTDDGVLDVVASGGGGVAALSMHVPIHADINGDWTVDVYDAILLANAYNAKTGDPNWNLNADINGDNIVDIYDAIILAGNYGKTA